MQAESTLPVFVSIVMTYHDRLGQLKKTLDSFKKHRYTNFEVIVVDDGSEIEPLSADMFKAYDFPVVVINMPVNKNYTNPSVPYNAGFDKATGDIIIIQNSECLHLNNVLDHARSNVGEDHYITYACFSLSKDETFELIGKPDLDLADLEHKIAKSVADAGAGKPVWKNHSKYRPNALHFTSAISKKNLQKLEGFDRRYAIGSAFDDDEIVDRIKRIPLEITIEDKVVVIHQWHTNSTSTLSKFNLHKLYLRNKFLYRYVTLKEMSYAPDVNSKPFVLYKMYSPFIIYPIAFFKATLGWLGRVIRDKN